MTKPDNSTRKRQAKHTVRTSIRLEPSLARLLEEAAIDAQRTLSDFVRFLLKSAMRSRLALEPQTETKGHSQP